MITLDQYFVKYLTHPDVTPVRRASAALLLSRVNALLLAYPGKKRINPNTKDRVSGSGLGGFRPQDCKIGAPNSAHKQALAVDVYDPMNELDNWIDGNLSVLEKYDLYLESPDKTPGWCHLSTRRPPSGNRVFIP